MKNILLLVHDDAGQEARFQAALDLTRALRGHLTCLDVSVMPVITGEYIATSIEAALLADERQREAENRRSLEARLAGEGVQWDWLDVTGTLAAELKRAAKMADLIVVSRQLDSDPMPDMRAVAGEVVVGSDRLVVAVPEAAGGFDVGGNAMVAWDGSDEAMNALQAAVPLLQLAGTVTIVEIDGGSVETPAEEAAAYLSRHGVSPAVRRIRSDEAPAREIQAQAEIVLADWIVMGGFGHSRLAEALFGGVTRDMLTESPVPTVLAH